MYQAQFVYTHKENTFSGASPSKTSCSSNEECRLVLEQNLARLFVARLSNDRNGSCLSFIKDLHIPIKRTVITMSLVKRGTSESQIPCIGNKFSISWDGILNTDILLAVQQFSLSTIVQHTNPSTEERLSTWLKFGKKSSGATVIEAMPGRTAKVGNAWKSSSPSYVHLSSFSVAPIPRLYKITSRYMITEFRLCDKPDGVNYAPPNNCNGWILGSVFCFSLRAPSPLGQQKYLGL